jgi:hypothetical protein
MRDILWRVAAILLVTSALAAGAASGAAAQIGGPPGSSAVSTATEETLGLGELTALLRQQQRELAAQRGLIERQSREVRGLREELAALRTRDIGKGHEAAAPASALPSGMPAMPSESREQIAAPTAADPGESPGSATTTEVADAQADDPTRVQLAEFPGAWRIPGTRAGLRIGGYVKTTMVTNFDALEFTDRFITGSIPASDVEGVEAESSITAAQSRLNFDLREPTEFGMLRAFIEGDFASDSDTFRLRHAFGQWRRALVGKTWSAFVDTEASPEEVDFEGLNGRISVRQSQIRLMPRLGERFEFQLSLEDPNPRVSNGDGVTRAPDLIASGRFNWGERLHMKLGVIGRQIRAKPLAGGGLQTKNGWGLTLSGRFSTPLFDERDSLLFQLNGGSGIGRYVNDLASVGEFDGIFDEESAKLELFDIRAGYASWQHWWSEALRSNLTFGVVDVDNPDFVDPTAYRRTLRASANLIWTPTPRIDVGTELLWGSRENEDGSDGEATQLQMSARYRF